ncbi:diguanylate cyclase [Caldimicrobium thiodismutans]|uniref:diguanylate cyclase n=1 Tax=Caldimicrobium thiodismutans TaxID=1653476 RepID=A0A0U5AR40_9BACT|nr:diguanylate cyclase [Caldimicrobium thiodismutans]BAU23361.1 diguanylate cyclase [Caldimicrobium thiodismutans]
MGLKEWIEKIREDLGEEIKILFYEPDPFIAELLEEVLQDSGVNLKVTQSLKTILPHLTENTFQILIMAIEAGIEEELSVIEKVKEFKKDLLVYAMVDYHKNLDISSLFMAGADEVIFKPFSLGEFRARLWRLLKEYYLTKKIEKTIVEDALTGVYNRRYFEITIREEAYRALRQKFPLTLFMIDLDKFKWYNDHLGHKAGDKVLIVVGDVICHSTRLKVDKVCRYGGDEFVVILPYTDWKQSLKVIERIFKKWRRLPFEPVTLSIGVAELIDRGSLEASVSDLINRADSAMYKAKKREGNTFVVDEETLKLSSNAGPPEGVLSFQVLQ